MRWTEYTSDFIGDEMAIKEIRIKTPMETGSEYLVIVKARVGVSKLIAFHGGETFEDALAGAVNKLERQGLVWKEDVPYEEKMTQRAAAASKRRGQDSPSPEG